MADHIPSMPHSAISEVFPDVFFVTGTTRPNFMGASWQFSRNMTVVRDGDELTLINTVRLDDEGLAALDALGKVVNVMKIGAFHGYDDPFYVDRYRAKLFALPGAAHEGGLSTSVELSEGGPMPFKGCSIFVFETSAQPEAIVRIDREGGILVSCDSLQNWLEPDRFFNEESATKLAQAGFFGSAKIGAGWKMACKPALSDFTRLESLAFKHLLSAHGTPLKDDAHARVTASIRETFV